MKKSSIQFLNLALWASLVLLVICIRPKMGYSSSSGPEGNQPGPTLSVLEVITGRYASATSTPNPLQLLTSDSLAPDWIGHQMLASTAYATRYPQTFNGKGPFFEHFNGGYGNYLIRNGYLSPGENNPDPLFQAIGLQAEIIRLSPERLSSDLEKLGDLLLALDQDKLPEAKYLAAFAYEAAASITGEPAHNLQTAPEGPRSAYHRKAIFAMDQVVVHPKVYNKVRARNFEQLWEAVLVSTDSAVKTGTLSPNPVFSAHNPVEISLFPDRRDDPVVAFINQQVIFEKKRDIGFNPNEDITNPDININAIKTNVVYNAYAIFLILLLIGVVAVVWVKFKRRVKEMGEN